MRKLIISIAILCCISCTLFQKYRSRIEVVPLNKNIDVSNLTIDAKLPDGYFQHLWNNGKQQSEPPNAGVEGIEWIISYGNFSGKYIDAKLIMNEPIHYTFLVNQDKDSSLFVQVKTEGGTLGDNSIRIPLTSASP